MATRRSDRGPDHDPDDERADDDPVEDAPEVSEPRLPAEQLGIDRTNERELEASFRGDVYVWDVDKTYLDTPIDSVRGLIKTAFEFAVDKRAFPGTAQVLRELRRGPGTRSVHAPLYFVSASPPTMRGVLERKMLLDGVEHDGLTLKNPVRTMRRGGLKALKRQVPYKLGALLLYHGELPRGARETLFGDDMEADPIIYSLYADVVAGRIRGDALVKALITHKTGEDTATAIAAYVDTLPSRSSVGRIFIHRARAQPRLDLAGFGPWLTPVRDSLQTSLVLWRDGKISGQGVERTVRAMRDEGVPDLALLASLLDGLRRKLYGGPDLDALAERLTREGFLPREVRLQPSRRVAKPRPPKRDAFRLPEELRG